MVFRKQSFSGQVVAITGGASGIGLALGRAFLQRGAAVALLDIDADGARARALELGQSAIGVGCDVTSEAGCRKAIAEVIATLGGVDVLVNNAGITQREAFTRTEVDAIRKVMEVNFFGAVNCTKAAQESLIERRGMIIVTSSIAGVAPLLGRAGYCASKHALHGLFGTIRAELREDGVDVLIVCPSFVDTNLQSRAIGGDGAVTEHPQSTVGAVDSPEQVAETILGAAERRRNLLVMSPVGNLSRWLSNLAPGLYDRLMSRKLRGEIER
jgi:NAD(P)-dependent dehydrogenase (short-subunit alcohol dehydrogenase family)